MPGWPDNAALTVGVLVTIDLILAAASGFLDGPPDDFE